MKQLFFVFATLVIMGCINNQYKITMEKDNIIHFGTKEFELFEETARISKKQAHLLCSEFCKRNSIYGENAPLYFIIDSNYVFTPYYNLKVPEVTLTGIWVNSNSGEVKFVKNERKIKPLSQFGWQDFNVKE